MLEAITVTRTAGDRRLLCDISLQVAAGKRIALVGPTGSGKSLLLRALALLDPIDNGEIHWQGTPVSASDIPRFRSRVMYLHQRPALAEGTIEENLQQPYALRIHRQKQFDRDRIVAALRSLGRPDGFLTQRQRDLSGGEAQLTALLRAMQLDPEILLLDEPTAALDAESTEMVESLVANWRNEQPEQRSTLWVTHDLAQAERVATSVLQIRDGQLSGAR